MMKEYDADLVFVSARLREKILQQIDDSTQKK
jgi:hypothetical protein